MTTRRSPSTISSRRCRTRPASICTRFKLWYHQAGTPEVTVSDSYDAAARALHPDPDAAYAADTRPAGASSRWSFRWRWASWTAIGQELGRLDAAGRTAARCVLLAEAEQSFTFDDVPEPARPVAAARLLGAGQTVRACRSARLRFLAAHDTDPFVRWESGQQYATRVLLDMVATWRRGEIAACSNRADRSNGRHAARRRCRPAFAAEALVLPGEAFLADQMTVATSMRSTRCATLRAPRSARHCATGAGDL